LSAHQIAGKVAVITGGARGIGLAIATALHQQGVRVAVGDIDELAAKEAGAKVGLPMAGALDVTSPESFSRFLDDAERKLGAIDILVNNAGLMNSGPVIDEPDSLTRRIIDVDVYGVIAGSKLAATRMTTRGSGHIINIASLAGLSPGPYLATYCASKHAVVAFTESLRRELRNTGVNVSAVLPTFTNTDMAAGFKGFPLVRNAEPEEIAEAVCRLIASPRPRVVVTRRAGWVVAALGALPNSVNEMLMRTLRLERVFIDGIDESARHAYNDRVMGRYAGKDER